MLESRTALTLDVLELTISELRDLLDAGTVTSVNLVQVYLAQIKRHNKQGLCLNAVISTVPEAKLLATARELDHLRSQDDSMWTEASLGVASTCGTAALEHSLAKANADVVQSLIDDGMILLGKANLTELGGVKDGNCKGVWSAIGGQGQSAYVVGGVDPTDTFLGHSTPAGSSSGSAVAVSAGMTPAALGTESDGSLLIPSDRSAVFTIKPTVGLLSTRGCLPFAAVSDCPGPMGKSTEDVALLLSALTRHKTDYTAHLKESFSGLNIGFLDPQEWAPGTAAIRPNEDYAAQALSEMSIAMDKVEAAGAIVKRGVQLRRFSPEDYDMLVSTTWRDFNEGFKTFTEGLIEPPVHSIAQLVEWNKAHADRAMPPECPSQSALVDMAGKTISDVDYERNNKLLRQNNKRAVDEALKRYDIDVIVTPPTGRSVTIFDMAGYPIGSLPLGYARFNGRAFGLCVVAPAGREDLVIRVMSAWETLFSPRKAPQSHTSAADRRCASHPVRP